jgi:hypothetical protein
MKYFLILLTAIITSTGVTAQSDVDSVKAVVNKMFEGMKNADSEMLRTCFADSVIFQTITRTKEGNFLVRNESVNGFIESISKLEKGAADEKISFETIKIDGPLAVVWTPYNFYYNGQFSHCGVNSFHLVRFKDGWKIQYLIDTWRKQGCNP